MPRQRPNTPAVPRQRRARNGDQQQRRARRRESGTEELELTEEELRALADENIDPEEWLLFAVRIQTVFRRLRVLRTNGCNRMVRGRFGHDDS